jgi:hypothetical protein
MGTATVAQLGHASASSGSKVSSQKYGQPTAGRPHAVVDTPT